MTLLSDYRLFPDIYGSEGSIVICLRCGGIFNKLLHYTFTAESIGEKNSNSVNIWQSYWQE